MAYLIHLVVLTEIYALLAVSLGLVVGQVGVLSLAHAALWAAGAYTSAILTLKAGLCPEAALAAAVLAGAVVGSITALPAWRIGGDYLALSTFGFQLMAQAVVINGGGATGGAQGLPGVPPFRLFGFTATTNAHYALVCALALAVGATLAVLASRSPFGRVMRAIREDEGLAKALGKETRRTLVVTFALSGALAAVAGSLYAHYTSYVSPSAFMVSESLLILSMVVIGGADSVAGVVVGALALVAIPEALRFLDLPGPVAAGLRQVLYGALLVVVVIRRPAGLLGRYRLGR